MKHIYLAYLETLASVAPRAGAWIEIGIWLSFRCVPSVAPLAGAWIEIDVSKPSGMVSIVAPLAGAWIEISKIGADVSGMVSLPSRERGLK